MAKDGTEKHPGGRPVEYDPNLVATLPDMFKEGQSITEVATELGIHRDTMYDWEKKYPEFSYALAYGRQLAQVWWEKQGREGLYKTSEYDGESKISTTRAINEKMWAKNMSCRFPSDWTEKKEVEHSGGVNITILDDIPGGAK